MSFLHLEIDEKTGDRYPVTARTPGSGEVTGELRLPWSDSELDGLLDQIQRMGIASSAPALRRIPAPEEKPIQQLGGGLYRGLPSQVRGLLRDSVGRADQAGRPLRVALLVHPPELARLPWEYLYDQERDDYLFVSHPLIRHIPDRSPGQPPKVQHPVRVLAMVGQMEPALSAEERGRLDRTLQPLVRAGHATLSWVEGSSWRQLQRAVSSSPGGWHVFHFIGHGGFDPASREASILLADDRGGRYWMRASQLADDLRGHVRHLVVLNACSTGAASPRDVYSSIAASLIRRQVPAVVAMQFDITNVAATEFSHSFYGHLADLWSTEQVDQRSVEEAVTEARKSVRHQPSGSLEWGFPVLLEAVNLVRPKLDTSFNARRDINDLAFSPDEKWLVLACDGRGPFLLDTEKWTGRAPKRTLTSLYAVTFRPDRDGTWFLTGGGDGAVRIWDTRTGAPADRLPRHPDWVGDIAFSRNAADLATACGDGGVRLWDRHRRPGPVTPRRVLPHHAPVRAVTFHPSQDRLATACDDGQVQIWDTRTGQVLHRLPPRPAAVFGVAYSPDGNLLATAGADGRVQTWDADRKLVLDRHCHDGGALSVAFSPDGRLLASAGRDGTAQIRDADTGDLPFTIAHTGPVRRVVFSPGGRWLATASYDNTCQVWQFPKEDE